MTLTLLVLALVVARREERGPEEVAPAGGTSISGGGGKGYAGLKVPTKMPSFLQMPKSEAAAWASIIGLTPDFQPKDAPDDTTVHSQNPMPNASVPADGIVHLEMR
jgi:hypothetical protein